MSKAANREYFELVEQAGPKGLTVDEFAKKFGRKRPIAQNWLSRWMKLGYLEYIPQEVKVERTPWRKAGRPKGSCGRYRIGKKEWGNIVWRDDLHG